MQETPDVTTPRSLAGFPAFEPMKLAAWVVEQAFPGEDVPHLVYIKDSFWEFYKGYWVRRSDGVMKSRLYQELEDAQAWVVTSKGHTLKRVQPSRHLIEDVLEALRSLPTVKRDFESIPVWLDGFDWNPEECVGFKDVVVRLHTDGSVETRPRTAAWFDVSVVPVDYQLTATCPLWERCIEQWSLGSTEWKTLLQRWMGYCIMNHRKYAKWLLMYEKSRAGKGTIARTIEHLVGAEGFQGAGVEDFTGVFALMGLETAKVLSLTEVHDTEKKVYERLGAILKRILGGDPHRIHIKYREPLNNVLIQAAPMMQANEMPKIPDRSGSISSKLLLLPFGWSTRDPGNQEDPYLKDKLAAELPGIALWALKGASDLMRTNGEFPVVADAAEAQEEFQIQNAPMDSFLEEFFVKNPEGFVSTGLLWDAWERWRLKHRKPAIYYQNTIRQAVKENTSWPLRFARPGGKARGLKGISVRVHDGTQDD